MGVTNIYTDNKEFTISSYLLILQSKAIIESPPPKYLFLSIQPHATILNQITVLLCLIQQLSSEGFSFLQSSFQFSLTFVLAMAWQQESFSKNANLFLFLVKIL